MQKPEERPYVVSTIRPSCILRTKQAPRWPSCSLQSRGHRSHWMRPSSSACHQRPGWLDSGTMLACEVGLAPLRDLVAPYFALHERRVRGETRLALQFLHEPTPIGQAVPYLRQESAAPVSVLENHPVHAGPQPSQQVDLVAEFGLLRGRKQ